MSPGERAARRAEALIGTRFRLHGRDPATGLDCVGLVAAAIGATTAPVAYRLRNRDIAAALAFAPAAGLVDASGAIAPGDVLLVRSGPAQHHLVIAGSGERFVHADAGLRRVVAVPAPLPWPVERRWRLASQDRTA